MTWHLAYSQQIALLLNLLLDIVQQILAAPGCRGVVSLATEYCAPARSSKRAGRHRNSFTRVVRCRRNSSRHSGRRSTVLASIPGRLVSMATTGDNQEDYVPWLELVGVHSILFWQIFGVVDWWPASSSPPTMVVAPLSTEKPIYWGSFLCYIRRHDLLCVACFLFVKWYLDFYVYDTLRWHQYYILVSLLLDKLGNSVGYIAEKCFITI
jgi:hypothetical protein